MQKTYSENDLLDELKKRAAERGQKALAADLMISKQMLNDVLYRRRNLTERVIKAMGYVREIVFRKRAA